MMPNLGWHRILNILSITNTTIIMSQPDYYQLLDKLIVSQPLNIWKNKIRFTILHEVANYLNKDFVQARFHMFDHIIHGQLVDKPRWMKIIDDMNKYIGELLGELYVSRYFPDYAKQRTINLTKHLIKVYHKRIIQSEWMSDITKGKAINKLNKLRTKIGYPSTWKTYDRIYMNRWSYFESMSSVFRYTYRKKIKDLSKEVDRDEWIFPPQTVNAFYNPLFNEIIFPAGILQEPFFLFDADDAINYGAVGFIIAHELTHGFDDQGRKYDANGNLRLWWTPKDINEFDSRAKIMVEQYNNYQLLNTNVNGLLTLGENIADLGGLEIAYEAFSQTQQAKNGILIDDLTPKQRFFLGFARASRIKMTDAKLLFMIKIDPHAPAIFRVNGVLSNMMGFYYTFNVTKNDKMFRDNSERVFIW
jgi:putative endopeptidase